ncbi:ABT1-like protein [Mya arenaria]|uniref:Activator of basal transcription 1 n=2 Tax=Mya arenaria TaxID=6604 RepID=A0ABY7F3U4_MYAAR|nr:ABT1-like protein [Mya arenaria]
MEENVDKQNTPDKKKSKKNKESGIIYLSSVPTLMNVNIVRRQFEVFGEVGRIFLQPNVKVKSRGKQGRVFSEGWVEFQDKKVAKSVAASLNNTLIGGKKKNRWREELWNIKYLHRFKWAHLNERLAYEKAVHTQRMRTEISQAKREANFYVRNAEKNEHLHKIAKRKLKVQTSDELVNDNEDGGENSDKIYSVKLRETDEEIVKKKRLRLSKEVKNAKRLKKDLTEEPSDVDLLKKKSFLTRIFSAGQDVESDGE